MTFSFTLGRRRRSLYGMSAGYWNNPIYGNAGTPGLPGAHDVTWAEARAGIDPIWDLLHLFAKTTQWFFAVKGTVIYNPNGTVKFTPDEKGNNFGVYPPPNFWVPYPDNGGAVLELATAQTANTAFFNGKQYHWKS